VTPLAALESRLGYRFEDRSILERALTHSSRAHEAGTAGGYADYERMEFLGDAILGFIVSERLMQDDPIADEGTLTLRKQGVVSTPALAAVSRRLGLGDALRLGRGEDATGGRTKPSLLADAFESVLAAVYLDGGVRAARAFVRRHLRDELAATREVPAAGTDPKTVLQELIQGRTRVTPRYRVVSMSGPAHARTFVAEVLIGGDVAGQGSGASRKDAERDAARVALATIAPAKASEAPREP
jgi:ribonuclease-3